MRSPAAKREARRARAAERLAAAANRSAAAQLTRLDMRGHGHCAEAQALLAAVSGEPSRGRAAP